MLKRLVLCQVLLLAGNFFTAGSVYAARDHERATIDVKEKKRKKSSASSKPGDGSGKPRLSTAEIFAVEVEKKLVKGIDKTIAYLKKTARSLPKKSNARLEMLTRVHNLHMEQAVYVASDEQRSYDKRWVKWHRGGRRGREPKLNGRKSRSHWKKVSETGKRILREYPKSKGADQINFNQALALAFLGQEKSAARAFTQIIKRYPNSAIAGDAYFALGDYHFDRNDFRNARNNFKSALKYRKSKRYGWALFKLGWCHYNLGQYKDALKYWKNTISHSRRTGGRKGLRLKEEALRDLVYAFAELKEVESAISYFRANGGQKYIGQFLTLLAETFADQGRFKRSIRVWQRLQSIVPREPAAATAQVEIVNLSFELGKYDTVWKELAKYKRKYGRGSSWASAVGRKMSLETQVKIQKTTLYYAKVIHKNAQKRANKKLYSHALKGYALYLKNFPRSKEVAEVKFNMGDIEYYRKDFRRSGMLYLEIALMGKNKATVYNEKGSPMRNIHSKSSKYMLDSYNRDFEPELKRLIKLKPNFKKAPKSLSVRAKNFIKACGYYTKWYPGDKKTIQKCDTFITEIYYRTNNRKKATEYLWVLATKYPKTKEGRQAVENLIPLYKNDKRKLLVAVDKLLAIPVYQKGSTGKKLKALKRAAAVEAIASENNKVRRAKLYEDRAKKYPKDGDAAKFWNNAAVDYLAGGAALKAITAYATLTKFYPKSPLSKDALLQLGKLYDRRLDFTSAATYYLSFARRYPKAKSVSASIQRACDLQIATNSGSAIRTCGKLIKSYPENAKAAFEKLINNAWRRKRYSEMASLINQTYLGKFRLSANEKIIANYKIYKAYGGKGGSAQKAASRIAGLSKSRSVSGEALRYIGEIAFKRANPALGPYLKVGLRGGSVENMVSSTKEKEAALGKVENAFGKVLDTKDSYWGIAAYHQVGYAYEQYANMLKNPPAIKGAKTSDVKKELSGSAAQIEGKAREYYNAGLDIARKLSVFNEWPSKLKASLARMTGKRVSYADWVVSPDFIGSEVPKQVGSAVWVGK